METIDLSTSNTPHEKPSTLTNTRGKMVISLNNFGLVGVIMHINKRAFRRLKETIRHCARAGKPHISSVDKYFFQKLIRPTDIVFDIGANNGQLSLFFASLCKQGKVIAFEPLWNTYEHMCESLQSSYILRAPIITVPLGLSDKTGVIEIHYPERQFGECRATIAPLEGFCEAEQCMKLYTFKCGVITLDMFMQTSQTRQPDFIKIDVEGAEHLVLSGGKSVFEDEKQPVLFTEVFHPWLRRFRCSPWDVLGYLQSIGYIHLFICPNGLVRYHSIPECPMPDEFKWGHQNVISCVPSKHSWVLERLKPDLAENNPHIPFLSRSSIPNE